MLKDLVLQRSLIYRGITLFKCTQYGEKFQATDIEIVALHIQCLILVQSAEA